MRILLLNQYFQPEVAASAQLLTELAEDLAAHHEVTVVAGRPSYDPPTVHDGPSGLVRVSRAPSTAFHRRRWFGRISNYITYLAGALLIALSSRRPHVVIVGSDPPFVALIGWCVSRIHRVPAVHLLWDIQPEAALAAGVRRVPRITRLLDGLHRRARRSAALVIVPTENMRDNAVRRGVDASRLAVVSHWADTAVISPQPKDNPLSRALRLVDRFVLMYSGNIGVTQSLECCVDLAERLRDLPDLIVVLVGDGAAKESLERWAKRRDLDTVRFLPYQLRSEVKHLFAAADLFLVPLRARLTDFMLPSKVFTIMASGRPLVAAIDPWSDVARLIRLAGCGRVVSPNDADALEEQVRWLYAHPLEREEMGRSGRRAAELVYARPHGTARYVDLLRRFDRTTESTLSRDAPVVESRGLMKDGGL